MDIVTWRAAHSQALYEVYQQVTAPAPHCALVPSLAYFQAALAHPAHPTTQIFVAEQGTDAVGFAALVDRGQASDGMREATIAALFVQEEAAGQRLLDACLEQARRHHVQRLLAFGCDHYMCPIPSYNVGWDGLSDRLSLLERLLAGNRFVPYHRELHLTCTGELYPPPAQAMVSDVRLVAHMEANGHQSLLAMVGEQEAGGCEFSSLASRSDAPGAAQCGYIWGLYTQVAFRRQGIGRQLMIQAMTQLYQQGCHSCWLTTAADNWGAQSLYLALGFAIVDASASFQRTLASG